MWRTIQASESESSSSSSECNRLCRAKDWSSLLVRAAELLKLQQQQQQQPDAEQSNGHDSIDDNSYHGKVASSSTCEGQASSCSSNGNDNTISMERSSFLLNHPQATGILSQAVRAGAPLLVLETLIQLDPQQVYHVTSESLSYKSFKITTHTTVLHHESIKSPSCNDRSTSGDDAGRNHALAAGDGLPCGITILHDAVRYRSFRFASTSRSNSNGSRVEEHHHHHQDDDDHCGWKILEFLVERILQQQQQEQQQQQQLEDNEPEKNTKKQYESSSPSLSSWRVGNDSKRDRYTTAAVCDDSNHKLVTHSSNNNNIFAVQDALGRTAVHYLVEQQLWQIQLLLSSSSATTNTSHDEEDEEDDATTTPHIDEQCSRSSLSPSISRILEASWRAFEKMITANPSVMQIMDSDGNTPLVLLLAASSTHQVAAANSSTIQQRQRHDIMEAEIFRRVQLMLTLCPVQVAVSRRVLSSRKAVSWRVPQWQQQRQSQQHQQQPSALVTTENNITCTNSSTSVLTCPSCASTSSTSATYPTTFPVHGLPLYHALLYGRCPETILELLRAQRCIGFNGCSVVVTQYAEYCLHIAVTRRAPLAVLQAIVDEYPDATLAPDIHGLTPLEWLWMSHVMDWHQATSMHHQQQQQQEQQHEDNDNGPDERAFSLLSPSRRRFLHRDYMEWYNEILDHHCTPYTADRYDFMATKTGRSIQNELLQRMKILLPRAAAEFGVAGSGYNLEDISLVHAACRLCGCIPRGMLQMVLAMDPDAKVQLRSPDGAGWYPLHYAAATPCTGYSASLPLGTMRGRGTSLLQEESPVALVLYNFPAASRATDINGQLPLHVAIDAAKKQVQDVYTEQHRHSSASKCTAAATVVPSSSAFSHEGEIAVLDLLLSHWPESIRQRDGKTRLFPWQQAAVGHGASLQTIYTLLRRDPTCVSHSID